MKLKTIYLCKTCQYETPKWLGRCPECQAWDSFIEDVVNVGKPENEGKKPAARIQRNLPTTKPALLTSFANPKARISTKMSELDLLLGGGIVEGSLTLLSGEPGIGKSTITLQICGNLATQNKHVLYLSGEESVEQLSLRAHRLGITSENIHIHTENNLENILSNIEEQKPDFVVVDSIQVLSSDEMSGAAGSVNQVRFCTEALMHAAKLWNRPILLIGHVTKEGTLAGPRTLEHLVDTVLYIEGDRYHDLRMLRSTKNRFGSTNEVAVFEMKEKGLKEVTNPSELFLNGRIENAIGSCLTATIEGTRPFIIEIQALTSLTNFGYPKRSTNGFDANRLQMIIAVLQEHGHINLTNQDVYVNIVGGMNIEEPAADLAVALAIASSYKKKPLPPSTIAIGEMGLSGEIRNITQAEKREKEAKKLGFTQIISPKNYTKIEKAIQALVK